MIATYADVSLALREVWMDTPIGNAHGPELTDLYERVVLNIAKTFAKHDPSFPEALFLDDACVKVDGDN